MTSWLKEPGQKQSDWKRVKERNEVNDYLVTFEVNDYPETFKVNDYPETFEVNDFPETFWVNDYPEKNPRDKNLSVQSESSFQDIYKRLGKRKSHCEK